MPITPRHVVIAPDAFKGGPSAPEVAEAIAAGWRAVHPDDRLTLSPMADGGEGTVMAVHTAYPHSTLVTVEGVTGPDGRKTSALYCRLDDGTAVLELASSSGLPKMRVLNPGLATTRGLGEVMAHALQHGATRLMIGLGGSASTDAGMGALYALGLKALDENGAQVPDGGDALALIDTLDATHVLSPPAGGITLLTDVAAPLTGVTGAAHVFGPQKGADAQTIARLDAALAHVARIAGGAPDAAGAGAAGGTGYGLATFMQATLIPGGPALADLVGVTDALHTADLVITAEGALDASTFTGKVVHTLYEKARERDIHMIAIAGKVAADVVASKPGLSAMSTSEVAGSVAASFKNPLDAIRQAAEVAAKDG